MPEPGDAPKPEHTPHEPADYIVLQPDGSQVLLEEALMKERGTAQAELDLNLLQPGDLLAMQLGEHDGQMQGEIFEVEEASWSTLGPSAGRPVKILKGKLSGPAVDNNIQDRTVQLIGSGWGGSNMSGNLTTSRRPYYAVPGLGGEVKNGVLKRSEYHGSVIEDFEIFRKNPDGVFEEKNPNQLAIEIQESNEAHRDRMSVVQELIDNVGFDDLDIQKGHLGPGEKEHWIFETDRFKVEAQLSGAQGNTLGFIDKEAHQWYSIHYYNTHNEGLLKISTADLEDVPLKDFHSASDSSALARAGKTVATFTTSEGQGLEAFDLKVGGVMGKRVGIPEHLNSVTGEPMPTGGELVVVKGEEEPRFLPDYYLRLAEDDNPGILDKLREHIEHQADEDGGHSVTINGHKLPYVKNPLGVLRELNVSIKQAQ